MWYSSYQTLCVQKIVLLPLLHSSLAQASSNSADSKGSPVSTVTDSPSALPAGGSHAVLLLGPIPPKQVASGQPWTNWSFCQGQPKDDQDKPWCTLSSPWAHAVWQACLPLHFDSLAPAQPCWEVATGCDTSSRQSLTKKWERYVSGELSSAEIKRWNPSVGCPQRGPQNLYCCKDNIHEVMAADVLWREKSLLHLFLWSSLYSSWACLKSSCSQVCFLLNTCLQRGSKLRTGFTQKALIALSF